MNAVLSDFPFYIREKGYKEFKTREVYSSAGKSHQLTQMLKVM